MYINVISKLCNYFTETPDWVRPDHGLAPHHAQGPKPCSQTASRRGLTRISQRFRFTWRGPPKEGVAAARAQGCSGRRSAGRQPVAPGTELHRIRSKLPAKIFVVITAIDRPGNIALHNPGLRRSRGKFRAFADDHRPHNRESSRLRCQKAGNKFLQPDTGFSVWGLCLPESAIYQNCYLPISPGMRPPHYPDLQQYLPGS